jgi:glycosyltransferase involved in cell wall biosynthesis
MSGDMTADGITPPQDGLYLQVYPSTLVNASRMNKIGRSLQRTGLFRETHLVGVHADDLPQVEDLGEGLRVVRHRGSGRRGNLGRILRVMLWQPRVFEYYRNERISVIAAHNVWVLPLCWLLSRRTGATLIYNAHELETETMTMAGCKRAAAKLIEARLVRKCALVSVVNEPIAVWYETIYHIARPVVVGNVPIVSDADVRFRDQLGIPGDEMLFIHTGHLVDGRNIPLILAAFADSPHHVVFLGDGPYRESIVEAGRRHPTIHWAPPVNPDLIVAHVREADVGLCLIEQQLDLSDRLSSPNKLMEALAAGIPALCSDLVEARRLLAERSDLWVLPDPQQMLAGALERITKSDCEAFRSSWPGVKPWAEEVAPLTAAVATLLGRHEAVSRPATAYDDADIGHGDATASLEPNAEKE